MGRESAADWSGGSHECDSSRARTANRDGAGLLRRCRSVAPYGRRARLRCEFSVRWIGAGWYQSSCCIDGWSTLDRQRGRLRHYHISVGSAVHYDSPMTTGATEIRLLLADDHAVV